MYSASTTCTGDLSGRKSKPTPYSTPLIPVGIHHHGFITLNSNYNPISMASSLTLYCAITAENGSRVPITVSSASITPTQLRLQASEATKIPLAQLRLIFRGRMIKDDTSLDAVKEYKLEDECVLHCMGKPNKDGDPASSDPQPAAAAASAPTISAAAPPASTINTTTTTTTTTASAAAPPQDPLQEALEQLRTNARSPDVYTTAISVSLSRSVHL
jgi:hypothetical protein